MRMEAFNQFWHWQVIAVPYWCVASRFRSLSYLSDPSALFQLWIIGPSPKLPYVSHIEWLEIVLEKIGLFHRLCVCAHPPPHLHALALACCRPHLPAFVSRTPPSSFIPMNNNSRTCKLLLPIMYNFLFYFAFTRWPCTMFRIEMCSHSAMRVFLCPARSH